MVHGIRRFAYSKLGWSEGGGDRTIAISDNDEGGLDGPPSTDDVREARRRYSLLEQLIIHWMPNLSVQLA